MNINYLISLLKSSLGDFRRNKVRTFLTSLGILIGVLSVVLLIALGVGLKNYIKDQFQSLGTNLLIVLPGQILSSGGGFQSGGGGSIGGITFDEKDAQDIKRLTNVEYAVPMSQKSLSVSSSTKSEISTLILTTADVFPGINLEIDKGAEFSKTDAQKGSKRAVIGPKIAIKLFGSIDGSVGKNIRIENQKYSVVGVAKAKGGSLGGPDLDSYVYIPYKSALSINPDKKFVTIYVKVNKDENVIPLKKELEKFLLKRYKEDEFSVIEPTDILNAVNQIFSVLNGVLVAIGSISLLVGGIGIMNIMYASVTERTKEIGIRRAIGATQQDILIQFMAESVVLSVFGGLLALILATLIIVLIRPIFPASLNLLAIAIALGISSFIGIFFGVFPARKAAKLSPIEAIRYE